MIPARAALCCGLKFVLSRNSLISSTVNPALFKSNFSEDSNLIAESKINLLKLSHTLNEYKGYVRFKYIIDAVKSFKGCYMQEVPKYSAVKVNGKKLYEYARNNIDVTLPSKLVSINNIEIITNYWIISNYSIF